MRARAAAHAGRAGGGAPWAGLGWAIAHPACTAVKYAGLEPGAQQRVYMGGFFAEERPVPRAWVDGAAARGSRWLCDDGWARMT